MEKCYPPSIETVADPQPAVNMTFDETSTAVANLTSMLDEANAVSVSPKPNYYVDKVGSQSIALKSIKINIFIHIIIYWFVSLKIITHR